MQHNKLQGHEPTKETVTPQPAVQAFQHAALQWHEFGLSVIPVVPGTKQPAVTWDRWLDDLSPESINAHWEQFPDHELGFIVGPDLIVFDADSPEAITAFNQLMASFDVTCNHIVTTSEGEHYYGRLAKDTVARSDAHDSTAHPDRLDIKTGRAMIILPPSTGKSLQQSEADSASDLIELGQDFVDAIYRHNGRKEPRLVEPRPATITDPAIVAVHTPNIRTLLTALDPDCGYNDWLAIGMAIHNALGGNTDGLELWDDWSSKGDKYGGYAELEKKWASFDDHTGVPVTISTLYQLAKDAGADIEALFEEFFEPIDDDELAALNKEEAEEHDLAKYSLRGMRAQFEADMQEQELIMGSIAISGQWTVLYAPPNAGKTLLVLHMLTESIRKGVINPEKLFYINADDNFHGLAQKLRLAEQHGFHMLAPGHKDFQAKDFLKLLRGLCSNGQALGTIIVLDTLKKFTDLMDKRMASDFGSAAREYVSKGGTLIALAHVNKNRDDDGKSIPAGTSDIVDDADCAYVLDTISDDKDIRTVEFENRKDRGMVAKKAAYQYSTVEGQSYEDLLASVTAVDESKATALKDATAQFDPHELPALQAIATCITEGITAKTKLVEEAASKTGSSKRYVQRVLENHTGPDPSIHHWHYTVGAHGAKTYALHPPQEDVPDIEEL